MSNDIQERKKTVGFYPGDQIRPLTRVKKKDGSLYVREEKTEQQIRKLLSLSEKERRRVLLLAETNGTSWKEAESVGEETLVYFIRSYQRSGEEQTAWELMQILLRRTARHNMKEAKRWRLGEEDMTECISELHVQVYEEILCLEERAEFWEVRFWVCLDRLIQNILVKRQKIRDSEFGEAEQLESEDADNKDSLLLRAASNEIDAQTILEHAEAVKGLGEKEKLALYLSVAMDLPEESADPTRETVAKAMGVTGRSVRNYLRSARQKLAAYLAGDVAAG